MYLIRGGWFDECCGRGDRKEGLIPSLYRFSQKVFFSCRSSRYDFKTPYSIRSASVHGSPPLWSALRPRQRCSMVACFSVYTSSWQLTITISSSGPKSSKSGRRLGGKGCKLLAFGSAGWNLSNSSGASFAAASEEEDNGGEDTRASAVFALPRFGRLAGLMMRIVALEIGEVTGDYWLGEEIDGGWWTNGVDWC